MEIGNKIDQIIETYADNFFENTMMTSMIKFLRLINFYSLENNNTVIQ